MNESGNCDVCGTPKQTPHPGWNGLFVSIRHTTPDGVEHHHVDFMGGVCDRYVIVAAFAASSFLVAKANRRKRALMNEHPLPRARAVRPLLWRRIFGRA